MRVRIIRAPRRAGNVTSRIMSDDLSIASALQSRKTFRRLSADSLIVPDSVVQSTSGSSDIQHGETWALNINQKVSGAISSFGSKAANDHRWDDCSGTDPGVLWDVYGPTTSGDPYDLTYRTPASISNEIALPHSRVSKYLTFAHYPRTTATNGIQGFVGFEFSRTNDTYTTWFWYSRCGPNWNYADADANNYKFWGVTVGVGGIYGGGSESYYYMQFGDGGTGFTSSSGSTWIQTQDDSVGGEDMVGPAGDPSFDGSGGMVNPGASWVHRWFTVKWQSGNTGYIVYKENNVTRYENLNTFTDAVTGSTQRTQGIEGYYEHAGTGTRRAMNDICMDHGPNAIMVVLANNATLNLATQVLPQPYVKQIGEALRWS